MVNPARVLWNPHERVTVLSLSVSQSVSQSVSRSQSLSQSVSHSVSHSVTQHKADLVWPLEDCNRHQNVALDILSPFSVPEYFVSTYFSEKAS